MNIILNGQNVLVGESTTFLELFQCLGFTDSNGKSIYKNEAQLILQNLNCQVKGFLQANDRLSIQAIPYRPILNTTPLSQTPDQNQIFNPQHRATQVQQPSGNQCGGNPSISQQSNIQFGQQPKFQFNQPFNQAQIQSIQPNSFQQQKFQASVIFQPNNVQINNVQINNVQANNQEEDVFSTQFQNQTYDEQRQNYLRNKKDNPGEKQVSRVIDGFRFTLDNYGDELMIEKTDYSFQLRITNAYKMNKEKRQMIPQITQEFESNVRMDLNYTRVSWIQKYDALAVQFNTGDKIFINLHME
ncbi:unnamed protein product [Paramecium octaurelia]|uniref:Uncharacterized protein n=1 Tax=Paramecium octaurelia TaxID=43137 RepID=A0A8S1T1Y5_PAROT|nr:unnamed protein product [Paramecium octaurelia]